MGQINNIHLNNINSNNQGKMFDYAHASQLFVADNYRLAPKYSFLYYVRFERDTQLSSIQSSSPLLETGMLVNSVALPKFTMDTKTLNAYNRTNIIQTKVKYDPVQLTFHDDSDNTVLDFWRDYYEYYYRDADYRDLVSDSSTPNYLKKFKYNFNSADPMNSWGYSLRGNASKPQLLNNIRIYSLNRGTFTEYILVNPMITSFQHGQHTASEQGFMSHTMTVAYEAVLYYYGSVTESTIPGMLDLHYDRRESALTPFGIGSPAISGGFGRPRVFGARSVLGPGGIVDTTDQVLGDIKNGNLNGALNKGFKSWQNTKNVNLKDLAAREATQAVVRGIITGTNPFSGINIPVISNTSRGVNNSLEDGADWANRKFGAKSQSAQNRTGSAIGAGYAGAAAAGIEFEQNQKLETNNSAGETDVTSNGESVSANKPGDNVFNSPTFRMPKDTSADINADFQPVVLNGSVQGPNNAASLRAAQNKAAGINEPDTSGSNWEPGNTGTGNRDGGGYTPYYARTLNNPSRDVSDQVEVAPENSAAPPAPSVPGIQGGSQIA